MQLGPAAVTVQLTREPGTNRYIMARDGSGKFTQSIGMDIDIDSLGLR